MKKLISILTVIVMLASASVQFAPVTAVTHGYILGDANDDTLVTTKDVLTLRRYIAGLTPDREISALAADVNIDGELTSKDVLKLRRMIAGLEEMEENNTDGAYNVGEIKIGGRNVSRFTIVIPKSVPDGYKGYLPSVKFAAEELRDNIKGACGIDLNVAYDEDEPAGYLIRYKYDIDDEYGLGQEGFVIEVTDEGDLVFTCGTMRGALYGTYTFLEDFVGYRYMTGYVNYLYTSDFVEVPIGYFDREVPTFSYRSIGSNGPSQNYAKLRINGIDGDAKSTPTNGGGVNPVYPHAHSFVYQMAGWDNWRDPQFEYTGGGSQPCLTDDTTYEKIIDFNFKLIDYYINDKGLVPGYDFTHVPCSQNDNGNFCACSECKAVYEEEGSVAGTLFRLSNRVAETICAEYPELQIYTVAYFGTQMPPKSTRPDPRVTVVFCNLGCNNHLLRNQYECDEAGGNTALRLFPDTYGGEKVPSKNGTYINWLKQWLEVTDNVWFWYYTTVYFHFASPSPNLFNFWDDMRYLAELGVKGVYVEGNNVYMDYNFEFMRAYLECKILWDPEMSEEEYQYDMDEYLKIVFGPGWQKIKQYIYMTDHAADMQGCWTNNFDYFWCYYNKEYFTEHYHEMRTLIEEARSQASDVSQYIKCDNETISLDFLGLSATYESEYLNGTEAEREQYRKTYSELWHKYNDNGIIENPAGSGVGGMANFPTSPSDVRDTMSWVGVGFNGYH